MFDKNAMTYASKINQPTAEEIMRGLNYALCINELQKYKVMFANEETIKSIKEKSDKISLENVVFVDTPVENGFVCVVNDYALKYKILLDKGLIKSNPEMESRSVIYGRGAGKSQFSFYDVKEE